MTPRKLAAGTHCVTPGRQELMARSTFPGFSIRRVRSQLHRVPSGRGLKPLP